MPDIPQLTPAQAQDRDEGTVLLDVREDDEVAARRIPGSTHIPLGDVPARSGQLDSGRPVITYCGSGRRSQQAAEFLASQGFAVSNMTGGITRWSEEGRPVVPGA